MLPSVVRRWLNRPKKSDPRPLAKFFYIDEEVNAIVHELQCLDVRKDPQNYLVLLSQLHNSQERMLTLLEQILEHCVPTKRRQRDYHLKFPDDLVNDTMTTHLLFAAELIIGGTYVEVEEADGVLLRPLAQKLLRSLEDLRRILREQSLEDPGIYPEAAHEALLEYDNLCAEFELRYMSLVVSVKTPEEIYEQQEIAVLFCETVSRALQQGYLTQEMIDDCEPELMISIPRLAIISGLLIFPDGPLNLQKRPEEMCELFSPFHGLLKKIRELLCILTEKELQSLERALCSASSEDPSVHLSSCLPPPMDSNSLHLDSQTQHPETATPTAQSTTDMELTQETSELSNMAKCDPDFSSQSKSIGLETNSTNQDIKLHHAAKPLDILRNMHMRYSLRSRFHDVRSRYRSDSDMLHRLFVCIAGVADQLQTNFASDLRVILKTVFEAVSSRQQQDKERTAEDASRLPDCSVCQNLKQQASRAPLVTPEWVPDSASTQCMSCCAPFTLLRRRHHCRSCGKIFCSRCSGYSSLLPHIDNAQPVRVCSHCYHVHCSPQDRVTEDTSPHLS
ncbi:PREDICTED: lateral signaling target protein 2 homolog isoform X2 [Nanorana parkeri]|uniref:lateral signaling target protein 2 homolog isoform X2 n=1 Tax=Nanorana parkeri TaxID=125878 RepID=UPI0008543FFA|nr:PREDICTED: lateral signaling target protein 2 homolog isoform X2 [Nanorana parkeri]